MPGEFMGGFNFERMAELIVSNPEFSQCLPLLKEAFQALTLAELKVDMVIQKFTKYYDDKVISQAVSEDCDGNSTISLSNSCDVEEGEPVKKKKKKKKHSLEVENEGGRETEKADNQDKWSSLPTSAKQENVYKMFQEIVSKYETDVPLSEVEDDMKEELILNTVTESIVENDSLMRTPRECSPGASSEKSSASSRSPRKRGNNEPFFPPGNNARPAPPTLRVIPSALLMENPPAETKIADTNSQEDVGVPVDDDRQPECSEDGETSNVLLFEVDREVDNNMRLTQTDVIKALKRDDSMRGCWITVKDMKRSGNIVSGIIEFPDTDSCLNTKKRGLRLNGYQARLSDFHEVEDCHSLGDDSNHPEPSESKNFLDKFWTFSFASAQSLQPRDGTISPLDSLSTSPLEVKFPQPRDGASTPLGTDGRFSQPRDGASTPHRTDGRFHLPRDSDSTPHGTDGRFPLPRDGASTPHGTDGRFHLPRDGDSTPHGTDGRFPLPRDGVSTPHGTDGRFPQPRDGASPHSRNGRFPNPQDPASTPRGRDGIFPLPQDPGSTSQNVGRYPQPRDVKRTPRGRGGRFSQLLEPVRTPHATKGRPDDATSSRHTDGRLEDTPCTSEHPDSRLTSLLSINTSKLSFFPNRGRGRGGGRGGGRGSRRSGTRGRGGSDVSRDNYDSHRGR